MFLFVWFQHKNIYVKTTQERVSFQKGNKWFQQNVTSVGSSQSWYVKQFWEKTMSFFLTHTHGECRCWPLFLLEQIGSASKIADVHRFSDAKFIYNLSDWEK